MMTDIPSTNDAMGHPDTQQRTTARGVAILRIALGLAILATWWGNVQDDFYSAGELNGFFDWLFTPEADGGNGSSLGFIDSLIDNTVLQAPGFFGAAQLVVELLIGVGLLVGAFTRLFSALAIAFFSGLFLSYFGGEEWIWTYVLLIASAITVFMGNAGRTFGADRFLADRFASSPVGKFL